VMKTHGKRIFALVAVVVTLLAGAGPRAASASDFRDFHGMLAGAYPHYREATFYLRTGNAGVALFELEQWTEKWKTIAARFGDTPPDVYADDPDWSSNLSQIADISNAGLALTQAGALKKAGAALEPIRELLAESRRKNHVVIFSDFVDRANQAFEVLFRFRHAPPAFDNADQLDDFRRAVAVTTLTYRRVMENAPALHLENPEFARLMAQSFHSLDRLWVAIREANQLNLINILREMRSSDRMLFLRFG